VAGPQAVFLLSYQDAAGDKLAPLTRIIELTPDLTQRRSTQEFAAAPRGGFDVLENGSKVAVLSLVENAGQIDDPPAAQLYSIESGAVPAPLRSLDGLAFFYDSDLFWMHDDLVIVDRVAPRVHRISAGGNTTYRLYEVAYAELAE